MKKTFLKLFFSAFATVMLFSSCLGDANNEIERTNAFAYITVKDGVQYAAAEVGYQLGYITSPLIKQQIPDECYLISYRISTNITPEGFYDAEDLDQPKRLISTYGRVGAVSMEDEINPTSFVPVYGSFDSFFGDNWGFLYKVKVGEKDTPRAHFFYDTEAQYEMVDGVRQDLDNNRMIIDVRFDNIAGADGTKAEREALSVGKLEEIKGYYKNASGQFEEASGAYTDVAIRFRYNQLQSDGTLKEVYVGDWSTESSYRFRYYKETE